MWAQVQQLNTSQAIEDESVADSGSNKTGSESQPVEATPESTPQPAGLRKRRGVNIVVVCTIFVVVSSLFVQQVNQQTLPRVANISPAHLCKTMITRKLLLLLQADEPNAAAFECIRLDFVTV